VSGGQWRAGQSGNPAGRRSGRDKYLDWFDEEAEFAKLALHENIMQRGNLPARNTAAIYVMDQAAGRPTQAVEVTGGGLGLEHFLAVAALNGAAVAGVQLELEGIAEPAQEAPAPERSEG
jgi:hypothetical protein